jgi:hypothetical protein
MLLITTDDVRTDDAKRVSDSQPIYVDDCFGRLHMPVEIPGCQRGSGVMYGLNEGKVTGHPSLRLPAEARAAAGYPSLRFGYSRTAGSRDIGTAGPWTTSQRNIHVAADWLRERRGASLVSNGGRHRARLSASLCGNP